MTSTLRVALVPSDFTGCGHYRCIYPMRALSNEPGLRIDVVEPDTQFNIGDFGVIVLQRPTELAVVEETIPYLRSRGWAVVVEIDDNLSKLDPAHFAFSYYHPRNTKNSWKVLERAAEMADMVTVTTPALAEQYGAHGRVAVIPNYLPASQVLDKVPDRQPDDSGRWHLGWPGVPSTHPGDLDVARRGMAETLNRPDWTFHAIGDPAILPAVGTTNGFVTPWVSMADYLPVVRTLDLGVVPLKKHEFNQGKSWLKGLEYASQGVPFVATDTDPYRMLFNHGAGFLADTPKDWRRALRELVNSPGLRQELAESGLDAARQLTVENNGLRWVEAWVQAMKNVRARPLSELRAPALSGPMLIR